MTEQKSKHEDKALNVIYVVFGEHVTDSNVKVRTDSSLCCLEDRRGAL